MGRARAWKTPTLNSGDHVVYLRLLSCLRKEIYRMVIDWEAREWVAGEERLMLR